MVRLIYSTLKLACLAFLVIIGLTSLLRLQLPSLAFGYKRYHHSPVPLSTESKRLVVASLKGDDTRWLGKRLPDWPVSLYVVNDPEAEFTVPLNKGRESMVYLTYIIDNYDNLPEISVFMHSLQYQWHNDDPNKDGATVISRLQLPYVREQGYVNMRCVWTLGCPEEINLDDPRSGHTTSLHFRHAFVELFPQRAANGTTPSVVGASCCAQFVVTASKIRELPKSEYERIREWLTKTPLPDDISGRILEYSWHMLFGRQDVHCPDARTCYCNVFGLCNLKNCNAGRCEGQYTLPKYASIPPGWKPLPMYRQW